LRSLFSGDIGCFPITASGGYRHADDLQLGYGDHYLSDFLLLDHLCGESHVPAGHGVAEILRQITIDQTSPRDLITSLADPLRAELPPGLKEKTTSQSVKVAQISSGAGVHCLL
jgi:hypothetical protein